MRKLIHKNCGGEIFINLGDVGQPEEGECLKCGEKITRREQVEHKPTEVEEKEEEGNG